MRRCRQRDWVVALAFAVLCWLFDCADGQDWKLDYPPTRRYEPGLAPALKIDIEKQPLGLPGRTGDRLGLRGPQAIPIVERTWLNFQSMFRYGDPDRQGRHIGKGEPLQGKSWLNRPWHVGWFFGGIYPDQLIDAQVDQREGVFGGYRVGYDFDHYWGAEARFGFANLRTQIAADAIPRTSRDWFWDVQLLYYPWGDAYWRPYAAVGLGTASFRFTDHLLRPQNEVLVHFPLAIGVKYYFKNWLALRLDAMDNLAISGSGLDTMHNLSVTTGVEVHFGGRSVAYGL